MKRVLLTGMSGTGKSTVIRELAARGYKAIDTTPRSLARVLEHIDTVEPRLREVAGHEIDTSAPLEVVVERVLAIVQG